MVVAVCWLKSNDERRGGRRQERESLRTGIAGR